MDDAMGASNNDLNQLDLVTESPDEIVKRAYSMWREAKEHKWLYAKDWSRYYLLYAGKHWTGNQPEWMSTPVVNLTFSVIETIVPILTDSRPQIAVSPKHSDDEAISGVLSQILDWLWEANDMEVKLPKVMRNAMIFGNGFVKIIWNPDLREGLGDIEIIPVDPSHIYISPYARTLQEADYVIHAENLPKRMVQRLFPMLVLDAEHGPELPELTLSRTVTSQATNARAIERFRLTDGSGVENISAHNVEQGQAKQDDLLTVVEKWEKIPGGKLSQTVIVNEQVVPGFPREVSYTRGLFPFVHFVDHQNTWSCWAMGEVQQVEQLQISVNRRRGHIQDILKYTATPILVVDPASGIEYEQLKPRPNLVIPADGGLQSVGWLQPPTIPNALFEANAIDKQDFDIVLGNVDVLQGRRPAGVEAGVAIELLQEAANVRMRLKVRALENSLKCLGQILVSMVQEFYTTERVFRVAGPEAMEMQEPLTKDSFVAINQPQGGMQMGEMGPEVALMNQIPALASAEFDVRIGPGSTLPISRSAKFNQVMAMYQAHVVDDVEVLKNSGLPHWQEILVRSRQYWGMMQQMAAQMQSAAAGPQSMNPDELNYQLEANAPAQPPSSIKSI